MDLVTDSACGEVTCRACGVVVEAVLLDDRMEYHSDLSGARVETVKNGGLLPCAPTVFNNVQNHRNHVSNLDPHSAMRGLFDAIDTWARHFSLDVRERAKLMCRDSMAHKVAHQSAWPIHVAAAVYLAAKWRGRGQGRSKREIVRQFSEFTGCNITGGDLVRVVKQFRASLSEQPYAESLGRGLHPRDLINRCVDNLGIEARRVREHVKARAHETMDRIPDKSVEGKTPNSICSGLVHFILQKEGVGIKKKTLAESCKVSVATLDKMHATIASILSV